MKQLGRNDPCFCGSGKKYKKCCMGAAKMNAPGPKVFTKSAAVYMTLIVIFCLSLFLRYYGFKQPHGLTFDEGLYAELLAPQLLRNPLDYSTQAAYRELTAGGERLPEYLDRPLFKHPPLFSYLVSLNYKLFGISHFAAVSVSILFGSLMVPLVFLMGRAVYDTRTGLLAAFWLCIDPVHWACSERIWMGTVMSFFILLAVYLFACFIRDPAKAWYLPLSGLAAGFAMLTKYPGAMSLFIVVSFAAVMDRKLLRQKGFWVMLLTSFLIFSPWVIWHWKVYGNFASALSAAHSLQGYRDFALALLAGHKEILLAACLAAGIYLIACRMMSGVKSDGSQAPNESRVGKMKGLAVFALPVLTFAVFPFARAMAWEAVIWHRSVQVGWSNPFSGGPWSFYLVRLAELSPMYFLSFLSFFFILTNGKGARLMAWSSAWILAVFILLGNYQTRYILPAVPFLLILSARFQCLVYDKLFAGNKTGPDARRPGGGLLILRILFIGTGLYFLLKTLWTGWLIAIGPDYGYF